MFGASYIGIYVGERDASLMQYEQLTCWRAVSLDFSSSSCTVVRVVDPGNMDSRSG